MERIHVSVRARPLSAEDAKNSSWRISGNSILIPNQPTKFEFDKIFGEDCKTYDVYTARTKDIVAASVRGFNGTVFAYGQTSSGKTHTMRGSSSEPGVIPLAVHDLFNTIHEELDREFLLRMSYLEIYNEEINDLLAPEHRKLQIHESIERGIYVAGLREEIVTSADQVLELMKFGEAHRHIGETNMNVYSSRSHTIFRMIIESREKTDDAEAAMSCDAVRVSVLNLVDLAGSERAAKTGAEGVRLKEGSHINKSLMTLGTVIKKLSEGAESQGGHVPYRDSKLTRILQPALGGNANTAIICNITLAQIHADETKSSLQFASRALRVTNCAHVNEILTDAALLKRQKKEIEELRAKLQGSKSEHLEEEILNLRNTWLKSELERERMALELEEEKKRQLEQAKKIENLSSMVFCGNREEASAGYNKEKRRDTWCPGNLARKKMKEPPSRIKENISEVKSGREPRKMKPLLPFDELIDEASAMEGEQGEDLKDGSLEQGSLPNPHALLHVTSRRKVPLRKTSLPMDKNDLSDIGAEFENLLLEFETHKTISDVQIDYLTRKLAMADRALNEKCRECAEQNINDISHLTGNKCWRDADATLLVNHLQEKVATLEMEKSSSQKNLESAVDMAIEQTIFAQEKCEKGEFDWVNTLLTETQEIKSEYENSKVLMRSLSSIMDELLHFSSLTPIKDLKETSSQTYTLVESIAGGHKKIHSCLMEKVNKLEDDKHILYNHASELCSRIEELSLEVQNSENAFMELNEKYESETAEFQCQLEMLQKEILSVSSGSLAKEKESMRKDLEKTKLKLKDTESKLRNAIQEKTKLEGEKSSAERELKRLQSQRALLERDLSKHAAVIGRWHDSTVDRSSNIFDPKRVKCSPALAELEDEYKKLEVLAFEMETTIASLEDQLAVVNGERDTANSRADTLASDFQALSNELQLSNLELDTLKEEVSVLRTLEESNVRIQEMERSLKILSEEKEDLSMQLTEALMAMEEEKAIWSSTEKASIETIRTQEKHYTAEISLLSTKLSEAGNELQACRQNVKDLEESLKRLEDNAGTRKQCRCFEENVSKTNLMTEQRTSDNLSNGYAEVSSPQIQSNCQKTNDEIETLLLELSGLRKERQYLLTRVQEWEQGQTFSRDNSELKHELEQLRNTLTSMENRKQNDQVQIKLERAKLRMCLHGTQARLDAILVRYQELLKESEYMNRKYEEATSKLKKELASSCSQVLHLTKVITACKCKQ